MGEIRGCRLGKPKNILKVHFDSEGYGYITLSKFSQTGNFRRCRIVATAFHGPPPFGRGEVDHLNNDPSDDRADNLEWVSREENIARAVVRRKSNKRPASQKGLYRLR